MNVPASAAATNLRNAHASLLEELGKLARLVQTESATSRSQVRLQIAAVQMQLVDHFGMEERNGWMNAVRQREPRLEHAIQQLVQEHREIERSLETLIEESVEHPGKAFIEKVLRWIQRVREHESRENELLENAFAEDLGAGD